MQLTRCASCGSNELVLDSRQFVCPYCRSRYNLPVGDMPQRETVITVVSDVQALLEKCVNDPRNRRRYAGLILDIDPTNREALKYLMSENK